MGTIRQASAGVVVGCVALGAGVSFADWPQWRGANRDGRSADFIAPQNWPKELKAAWKVSVGDGVATPALVGDRLYVFSRQNDNEVLRCLDAKAGKEIWQEKYPAAGVTGPAGGFPGPRSSPAVSDGKVVTLGVHGTLSCFDAETGKLAWRKDEYTGSTPRFQTSSSPVIIDRLAVAQLGGQNNGALVAYDLNTGDEKWKWTGDGPGYASPVLMTVGGDKLVIAETDGKIVAVRAADGKVAWETPFKAQGMGGYNAATPVVDGDTLIYSGGGRGTRAVKIEKSGESYDAKELWNNPETAVQFNSPVLKDGMLYGLSQGNELFAIDAKSGKTVWTAPAPNAPPPNFGGGRGGPGGPPGGPGGPGGPGRGQGARGPGGPPGGPGGPGGGPGGPGGRGGRGGGGGGRGGGYGSIVDAGAVLLALTPASELIVFKPGAQYAEIAKIKVSDTQTHAYPIATGKRLIIKDKDAVSVYELE